jgi:hypothetical protein
MDYVNRDERGYVDFEKMIGLDGIAIINIVSNPGNATLTGKKDLRTLISHNDGMQPGVFLNGVLTFLLVGGTWKPIVPPKLDSHGNKYECDTTVCNDVKFQLARISTLYLEMRSTPSRIH